MNSPRAAAVLLGPPASGKTTVARAAARHKDIVAIEVGRLLRHSARSDTERARTIQEYVERGKLVPIELVESVVQEELDQHGQEHILFDGFPRSEEQLDSFAVLVQEQGLDLRAVVRLDLSVEEAVDRLSARRVCAECGAVYHLKNNPPKQPDTCDRCGGELIQRRDDEPSVIRERYEDYERRTRPVWEVLARDFPDVSYRQSGTIEPQQIADRIARWLQMDVPRSSGVMSANRTES